MVTWFAGLFYLPRLFVYHAMSEDAASIARFKVMEHKLFFGIMTPGAVLTLIFGIGLLVHQSHWLQAGWLHAKLSLIIALLCYHIWCGKLLNDFKHERNPHSHRWYRWFNEAPVLALIAIILLAVLKPF